MTHRGRNGCDRGSATVELVLLLPLIVMMLFLVVGVGRASDAKSDIVSAASDAARAASLQNNGPDAVAQAQAAATDTASGERLNCNDGAGPDVTTDFLPAFGRGATVHVTVTCVVNLSDLTMIGGMPNTVTLEDEAWEPIDEHRSLPP